MPFDSDSVTVRRRDDDRWTLTQPLIYRGNPKYGGDVFRVPAGYVTDFASVPRAVVWLIPRFGRYTLAAVLHDYLIDCLPSKRFTSRDVDGLFRRVPRELEVPPLRRWLMWCGVRWGALLNERRRPGWKAEALPVIGLSLVALPFVVPGAIVVLICLGIYRVLEAIAELAAVLS